MIVIPFSSQAWHRSSFLGRPWAITIHPPLLPPGPGAPVCLFVDWTVLQHTLLPDGREQLTLQDPRLPDRCES